MVCRGVVSLESFLSFKEVGRRMIALRESREVRRDVLIPG